MRRSVGILVMLGMWANHSAQTTFNNQFLIDGFGGVCCSITPVEEGYLCTGVIGSSDFNSFSAMLDANGELESLNTFTSPYGYYQFWGVPVRLNDEMYVNAGYTSDSLEIQMSTLLYLNAAGDSLESRFYYSPFADEEPEDAWDLPSWFKVADQTVDEQDNIYQVYILSNATCGLRKLTSDGEVVWSNLRQTIDAVGLSYSCVELYENVLYYQQSWTYPQQFYYEATIFRTTTNGEELDPIELGTSYIRTKDIEVLGDGSVLVAASAQYPEGESISPTPVIARVDTEGNTLWELLIGVYVPTVPYMREIIPLEDGNYVVCGESSVYNSDLEEGINSNSRANLIKFTEDGEVIWWRIYVGSNVSASNHAVNDFKLCPDGGFVFCGETSNYELEPSQRPWVVKTDEYGCVQPGCHLVDGVEEYIWDGEESLSLYPNPTSNEVTLSLGTGMVDPDRVEVRIYTSTGALIATHTNFSPLNTEVQLDITHLRPGLYQVALVESGKLFDVDRLVVE